MDNVYDHIVIGAGLGGLSAACLLVQKKKKVLLLEAHSCVGGCASYFARKKFLFDAGATTLSGMQNEQPVQRLLQTLEIDISLRKCNPGMVIHQNGKIFHRWTDLDQWIVECEKTFGMYNQRKLWTLVHFVAKSGWQSSYQNKNIPFQTITDYLELPFSLRHAHLIPFLFRSVADILHELNLHANKDFTDFITEQLMITAQSGINDTSFLVGAMGLAYPSDTWYVEGGMNNFSRTLQKYFTSNGGELLLKKKVTSVQTKNIHEVTTEDQQTFRAKKIISNATGWNNREILTEQESYFAKEYSSLAGWGAFTLYVGVKNSFNDLGSLYHQIILDVPLPHCTSNSIFLSFSPIDDHSRAQEGFRTLTVSTHIASPHQWWKLSETENEQRKSEIKTAILSELDKHIPHFNQSEKPVVLSGTPITFEHFTNRKYGMVGGIPQSMDRPIFLWRGWRTKKPGVYLVGDTIYPGQGAPGVILGALNLVSAIEQ